jgi:hypothetical protein
MSSLSKSYGLIVPLPESGRFARLSNLVRVIGRRLRLRGHHRRAFLRRRLFITVLLGRGHDAKTGDEHKAEK